MPQVNQNPRPMPKPTGPSRDEVKARVRAKVEAERALPAGERIANTLHATHTTAGAQALLAELRADIESKVRAKVAADFAAYGKTVGGSLSWGQAHEIAMNGLCSCSGGDKPCDMGGV